MKKLFTLLTMLIVGIGSMWGQSSSKWTYTSSVTVDVESMQANSLKSGDKIVFARKSNSSYYLTVNIEGCILGTGNNSFQSASGLSVFTVGGSTDKWTFESARDGYFFPTLNTITWDNRNCVKTDSPAEFKFIPTGDGDNSYYIQDINTNNYFDGDNAHFTAWNSAGSNSKYFIYSVVESEEKITVISGAGEQSGSQYQYKSPTLSGSPILKTIRLTFKSTNNNSSTYGYPFVHFAEFYLYDKDGNSVDLTKYSATSIFSSNATETSEGNIAALNDGATTGDGSSWYWHSAYKTNPGAYHYLEINASAIDADLSTFQIGYITRNSNCVPTNTEVTMVDASGSADLIALISARSSYTDARDHQLESNPLVGLKPYSETNALKEAVTAGTPDSETILSAYMSFYSAAPITLQSGKTYRIVSAYPDFETHASGDKKKKVIYSDGSGLRWEAIDVTDDYFKSVWVIANVNGNNITMLNLNDACYPQAQPSYYNKFPISRSNAGTCTLNPLGSGQFNITPQGSINCFHCGGHASGEGTSGDIVPYPGGKDSQSSWYIQEVSDITMPTTGYYRIKNKGADYYMKNNTGNVVAVGTSDSSIKTIFSLSKNDDGTYYLRGDDGKYVQEATRSSQAEMTLTPVKYFITRNEDNLWNLRAKATVENDYTHHFLHKDGLNKIVGWENVADNSKWTIEVVNDYTYYPVELTGPSGAEMAIRVETDGYTGSTTLYNGGFYAFTGVAPTASSFGDYAGDILETNDIAVSGNKITASFTAQDETPIFTVSDETTNAYYYIHNSRNNPSDNPPHVYINWYLRATSADKVAATNTDTYEKTTDGAGVFQFYAAELVHPQGYPQYYIYNTGAQAWVTYNSVSAGTAKVELVSNKASAKPWVIVTETSGATVDVIPGELNVTNTAQSWNAHGGFAEGKQLGLYSRDDGNSSWTLESVALDASALAKVLNDYVKYYAPSLYAGISGNIGELGYPKQTFIDGLVDIADVNTLKTTWSNRGDNDYVRPESGHFYKLLCAGDKNQYIADANYNDGNISVSATDEDNVWCYYGNKLIGYKSGCKLYNNTHLKLAAAGTEGVDINFKKSDTEGQLFINYGTRYAYGNYDNSIDSGSGYNSDLGYRWKVTEVTLIPVTFNSAALGYATFNSPVALKVPTDVIAYVCKIDGSTITLHNANKFTDDGKWILPANTPVLLYNEDYLTIDTKEFEVTSTTDSYEGYNDFSYTVATENPDHENYTYYALRKKSTSMGFYQRADQEAVLPGFRAWIKDPVGGVRNFTIVFDGDSDPTGIVEALGLENDNVEIYDLSGRKLSSCKNGINIVNGKKVFK